MASSRLALGAALAVAAGLGAATAAAGQTSSPASSPPAQTPNSPSTPSASPGAATNEIVVTAQKRSETVQHVPLSITAYSGAQLTAQGITTIEQVGYMTPGVSERNSGPGQTEFEMRGIASSGGQSPTVGFYLDDTPLTPPNDAQLGNAKTRCFIAFLDLSAHRLTH